MIVFAAIPAAKYKVIDRPIVEVLSWNLFVARRGKNPISTLVPIPLSPYTAASKTTFRFRSTSFVIDTMFLQSPVLVVVVFLSDLPGYLRAINGRNRTAGSVQTEIAARQPAVWATAACTTGMMLVPIFPIRL